MKIGFVSLGCPKNLVDSEVMLGLAERAGHTLTADAADADVLVVNTCSFIESARQESIDAVLELAAYKRGGRCRRLVVTGCMAERYRDELQKEIPEIDVVLGTNEVPKIVQALEPQAQPPVRDASGRAAARLPVRRPHPSPPHHPRALRLREDCRGLQLQVRLLHHPAAAGPATGAVRPPRSCVRPEPSPREASRNCCSSPRTRPTSAMTGASAARSRGCCVGSTGWTASSGSGCSTCTPRRSPPTRFGPSPNATRCASTSTCRCSTPRIRS